MGPKLNIVLYGRLAACFAVVVVAISTLTSPATAGTIGASAPPIPSSKALDPEHGTHAWAFPSMPNGTVSFPNDGFRLEPASAASQSDGKIATQGQALGFLKENVSLPSDTEILDGPGVWFGLFSNDASGVVQGDGSLAPLDQIEPAWLFVWTLNDSVIAGRRLPGGNPAGHHPPGDCVFLAFVTTTALIPIAGQECKSPDGPPVFVVKV